MKKAIQFDVDGVLADFFLGYTRQAGRMGYYGGEYLGDADNIRYGTKHFLEDPLGDDGVWNGIKQSPDFWLNLAAHVPPSTFLRINDLQRERVVYFCTHRMGLHPHWQTAEWLRRHGIENPTVVITDLKGEFARAGRVQWSIEDKADNALCVAYASPTTTSVILDRPYNRFDPDVMGSTVVRVTTVDEFLNLITKGAGE